MEAPRPLPQSRRHRGARDLARGLCLGALTLALLGPAAASAGAVAGPGVQIVGPSGTGGFITPAEMSANSESQPEAKVQRTCATRGRAGETPQLTGCHGLPVLIALHKVGIESFGYLTIPRANGTTAYLSARDFEQPKEVFEGEAPPLFILDTPATRFYRPLLSGDADDVNAADNTTTVSGEALVVGVHNGNVLVVTVTPSTTSTSTGTPVSLSASASGGESGESVTFDWSFGDGTTATGPSVRHAFAGSGTYEVRVTAEGSDESGGESGPVDVVVGNPPTTEAAGAAAPSQPAAKEPDGVPGAVGRGRGGKNPKPGGSGGKTKKESNASPKPGDASPVKHPESHHPKPHPSTSPQPVEPRLVIPEPTPALPAPEPATPEPVPPLAEPSGGDSPEPPRCCSAESPPEGSPRQTSSQENPTRSSPGQLVEGRLVGDDLGPTSIEEALGSSAEGQGSRSAPGAVAGGWSGVPVVALIVVALLAGGAFFEWRRSRPVR